MARMGYMGSASINGVEVYLTGSSLNPVQQINAPDVVQGSVIKRIWNWSKVEVGGNCTGPLAQGMGGIWTDATSRVNDLPSPVNGMPVVISYIQGGSRSFSGVHINTMEVSVTAGEVAQFSIDFLGAGYNGTGGGGSPGSGCVVLVTWDQCSASIDGAGSGTEVQAASISVNNNLERLYKLDQDNMNAFTVLGGFKEITGSVSYYAEGEPGPGTASIENCAQDTGSVSVDFGGKCGGGIGWSSSTAAIQRAEASATTGPGIYTYNFTVLNC